MQSRKRNIISQFAGMVLSAVLATVALSSCERIFEDLDPCPHGVSLRFVYDYNMEFANAFPRQVDCLTLYIYDDKDNYVDTRIVTGTELQDEDYRMTLDLEKGNYHFVAYGGLACDKSSFSLLQAPAAGGKWTDLRTAMDADCLTDLYSEGTVKMMKNTNSIRIVLQHVDGTPVKADDFDFEIIDDNTFFSYDNDLLPNGDVTYIPWAKGQAQTGVSIVGPDQVVPQPVEVAYAELCTSRLMTKNSPRLLVKRHEDGGTVIDFPLNNYLLLMRSDRYSKMGDQEYLDRESRWTLYFFLQAGIWLQTRIVVNDWVVRINDIEM